MKARPTLRQYSSLVSATLFGDPRRYALEHRLFNTISLLNAVANIGGAFGALSLDNAAFLFGLNFLTGILFLLFYYLARFRKLVTQLYWPFVGLILVFLSINTIENAGSRGGAHYYFIPALVIAIILSGKASRTVVSIFAFTGATALLLYLEEVRPDWFTRHASETERAFDVAGNLLFVQLFMGVLVQVLTQNLNQERRKSDRLLRSVLPEAVAQELKQTDRVQPVDYESATVLFTDFVGFTQIAESFTPQELIEELDSCFSQFDRIARKHKLEKIKTIGDAYMAVGGVPLTNQTHAVDCVLAALEIEGVVDQLRAKEMAENRPYWQIRVGIHSGDLVAGIVGREKFSYDVWGDTVNTASRLESSGVAGRINISSVTYELVKDFFECEYRGKVPAKNKGEFEMYFVNRIRAELSRDAAGLKPNEAFMKLYRHLSQSQSLSLLD